MAACRLFTFDQIMLPIDSIQSITDGHPAQGWSLTRPSLQGLREAPARQPELDLLIIVPSLDYCSMFQGYRANIFDYLKHDSYHAMLRPDKYFNNAITVILSSVDTLCIFD